MRNHWYPIMFLEDLGVSTLAAVELCGQPVVIFRDHNGVARCLEDACAHRSAPLSLGTLREGQIECRYHGWRFGGDGRCMHLPTLASHESIPKSACVRSLLTQEYLGLLWVWAGAGDVVTPKPVMAAIEEDVFGKPGWAAATMLRDIDVHHSLLTENLLDPAHVFFVHDGTIANRNDASPLGMVLSLTSDGFVATHRGQARQHLPQTKTTFYAPSGVRIEFEFMPGKHFVQSSYCVPIGRRRVRLIFRAWRDFDADDPGVQAQMQMHAQQTLEQDLALLIGLQARIDAGYRHFVTPVREDQGCLAFRRWYEREGQGI